jgi:hypothetical protein
LPEPSAKRFLDICLCSFSTCCCRSLIYLLLLNTLLSKTFSGQLPLQLLHLLLKVTDLLLLLLNTLLSKTFSGKLPLQLLHLLL